VGIYWSDDIHTNVLEELGIANVSITTYFTLSSGRSAFVYTDRHLQRILRNRNGRVDNITKESGGLYVCHSDLFGVFAGPSQIEKLSDWLAYSSEQWSDIVVVLDFLEIILWALIVGFVKKWEAFGGEYIGSEFYFCYLSREKVTGVSLQGFEELTNLGMRLMNLKRQRKSGVNMGFHNWGHLSFFFVWFMGTWVMIETFSFWYQSCCWAL
jgi:hypothetical protein